MAAITFSSKNQYPLRRTQSDSKLLNQTEIRTQQVQKQAIAQIPESPKNENSALLSKSPVLVQQSSPKTPVLTPHSPPQSADPSCAQKACNNAKRYSGCALGVLGVGLVAAESVFTLVTNGSGALLSSTVLNPFWVPGALGILVEIGCQVHERCQGENDVNQPTAPTQPAAAPATVPVQTSTMTIPPPPTKSVKSRLRN